MTKSIYLTAYFFLFAIIGNAQIDVGILVGGSGYYGDIASERSGLGASEIHLAGGIFGRLNHNKWLATRFSVNYAKVSGDDQKSRISEQFNRNLNFRSTVIEFGLAVEWNILGFDNYTLSHPFSPYLFAGISGFKFNPQAYYDNSWVNLKPLRTEGQGLSSFPEKKPYSLLNLSIPFGVGVKYALNDKLVVGLEFGLRKTFTDYLDDVSGTYVEDSYLVENVSPLSASLANRSGEPVQTGDGRGDSSNKDWYYIFGAHISYSLTDNGLVGRRWKSRRKSGCKTY